MYFWWSKVLWIPHPYENQKYIRIQSEIRFRCPRLTNVDGRICHSNTQWRYGSIYVLQQGAGERKCPRSTPPAWGRVPLGQLGNKSFLLRSAQPENWEKKGRENAGERKKEGSRDGGDGASKGNCFALLPWTPENTSCFFAHQREQQVTWTVENIALHFDVWMFFFMSFFLSNNYNNDSC